LMKSRRRIAFPKAQDHANIADYSRNLRLAEWGSELGLHDSSPKLPMSALPPKARISACNSLCWHLVVMQ
jgi:hypothetical protein